MRKATTRDYEPANYPKFDIGDDAYLFMAGRPKEIYFGEWIPDGTKLTITSRRYDQAYNEYVYNIEYHETLDGMVVTDDEDHGTTYIKKSNNEIPEGYIFPYWEYRSKEIEEKVKYMFYDFDNDRHYTIEESVKFLEEKAAADNFDEYQRSVVIRKIKDDINTLKKENDKLNLSYDFILGGVIVIAIWLAFFTAYLLFKTR